MRSGGSLAAIAAATMISACGPVAGDAARPPASFVLVPPAPTAAVPAGVAAELAAQPAAVPAAEAGAIAPGASAELTLDLAPFVARVTGRRLLAVLADLERLVVTIVAADGLVHSQTVSRADIAANRLRLTFPGLALGSASVRVVAEDAGGGVISAVDQTIEVGRDRPSLQPINLPLAPGSTGGGGSSGPPDPPSPPPGGPTGLDVAIALRDALPLTSAPITWSLATATTGDGRKAMTGSNLEVAWGAGGDAFMLRNAIERWGVFARGVVPFAKGYDEGAGEIVRLGADGTLKDVWTDVNARALAAAPDGTLWAATWPKGLRHLAADGSTIASATVANNVALRGLAVDAAQVWVAHGAAIARFTPAGALAGQTLLSGAAGSVARDRATGAIWAVAGNRVVKLGPTGAIQRTSPALSAYPENPYARLAVAADGGVWVTLDQAWELVRLNADGTIAMRTTLDAAPLDVLPLADGGACVSVHKDRQNGGGLATERPWTHHLVKVAADGTPLAGWKLADPGNALTLAADGSIWSAGWDVTRVVP